MEQEARKKLDYLKRINKLSNYWETWVSFVLLIVSIIGSTIGLGTVNVMFIALCSGLCFVVAQNKRFDKLSSYHNLTIYEILQKHAYILTAADITLSVLDLYAKADEKLGEEDEDI